MYDVYEHDRRMLNALLRIPYQAINERTVAGLAAAGFNDIRTAHASVFQHLPREGARATDLAERAQITKQSMSYLLEYLEARGYVERIPDPHDGRARIVRLTERGWAVDTIAREVIASVEREWRERIGSATIDHLHAILHDIVHLLENEETKHESSRQ